MANGFLNNDFNADGEIASGGTIASGADVTAVTGVNAGNEVTAGTYITAGSYVDATTYVNSDSYLSVNSRRVCQTGNCSVAGDGVLYLASGSRLNGIFTIRWAATNRDHTVTVAINTYQYGTNASVSVISDKNYQGVSATPCLTTFRCYKNAAGDTVYLACDIGNRNGGTGDVYMAYYGAETVTFGPTAPGAPVLMANLAQRIDWLGRVRKPYTTQFLGVTTGAKSNVTGDGTSYTQIYDSEITDPCNEFVHTTGIFTSTYDGSYSLSGNILVSGLDAVNHDEISIDIVTSNRSYRDGIYHATGVGIDNWNGFLSVAAADMDAADTAYIRTIVNGVGAGKTAGIGNSSSFSGYLAC